MWRQAVDKGRQAEGTDGELARLGLSRIGTAQSRVRYDKTKKDINIKH